ncbi:MAG: AI-2E family transporter [Acidobacteriota bacterium]
MRELGERAWLTWIAIALLAASAVVLWPFAPWILLAVWASVLVRPLHARIARAFGDRPRLAAAITVVVLALVLVPVVVLVASLAVDAIDLVHKALASDRVQGLWQGLVAGDGGEPRSPHDLVGLAVSQGGRAWGLAQQIAGTAAHVVIGLVILIAGTYALLVDGGRWYAWLERHAPVSQVAFRRFAGAFVETGRGLLFGVLGAGLAQAIVATVLYLALGVPRAFALGLLTLVCSIIPAIGTAIVWVPISIALALAGRDTAAVILGASGLLVIGTIDNLVRPYLARRGSLALPTYLVLISMFGGVAIMGARGLVIAPLVVRLAKEALSLRRDAVAL